MGQVGIEMLHPSGYCGSDNAPGTSDGDSDFDDVYADIELYGRLLGTEDRASASVADLRERVDTVSTRVEADGRDRSAAVLYATDAAPAAYGSLDSMPDTQLEMLGLRNVFADVEKGFFEPGLEEIIKRNPDVLILLTFPTEGQTDADVMRKFMALPGIRRITAVRNEDVLVQQFAYSAPSTLSVDGLENAARRFLAPG